MSQSEEHIARAFVFFNEIGIISQLGSTQFQRALPDGLTQSQFFVLNNFVRLGGTRTPAQLASAFEVTKGAMTNTLNKLEARGCVVIEGDPGDGRRKIVRITPKGKATRERAIKAAAPLLESLAQVLEPADLDQVLPVLQKVRAWLDDARSV